MRRLASPVTSLLLINFFFGFFALLVGFGSGHQFNDVVGDFRRLFFYPLATLVAVGHILRRADVRKLILLFSVVLLIISGIALVRVTTGQTWDPAQFAGTGDFRAIGYFTGVIVIMGLGVFYGLSLVSRGYRKWASLLFSMLLIGVGFLSGYRLLWVLAVMSPLFVSYAAYRGRTRNLRLILTLVVSLAVLVGALLATWQFFPDWFLIARAKFEERVLGFSFQDNVRYVAWKAAWNRFQSSPIVGVGIGDQFSFWGINSAGNPHLFRLTTHNVFLTILYQTGVIGGSVFLAIHLRIIRYVWTHLPKVQLRIRAPLAGMFSGYLAALVLGMLQPLFESPGAIVGFYLWTGLMLRSVRICTGKEPTLSHPAGELCDCS
jgi:O-antigen ligase